MCTTPAPHPRPTDKSLPEFPTGWYCVGFSDELQSSTLLTRRLMNQELVLYRNEKQEIVVAQAHCPHLGAHFGHGGKIIDGELECLRRYRRTSHAIQWMWMKMLIHRYQQNRTTPTHRLLRHHKLHRSRHQSLQSE